MRGAAERGSRNVYGAVLERDRSPEFVREALRRLEADHRTLALCGLAAWEQSGVVASELFTALASLQRPSWGSWNGLLHALRKARKSARQSGQLDGQQPTLEAIFRLLDGRIPEPLRDELKPLAELARSSRRRLTWSGTLAIAIAVRNRVVHDTPEDPEWWDEVAAALRPLVAHLASTSLLEQIPGDRPEPWFRDVRGQPQAFNGLTRDFAAIYAGSSQGDPDTDAGAEIVGAFQRLLGKADVQARDFRKLMGRLAPDEVKGVLLGDFLVGAPVGRGGFATVHAGRQLSTGRPVAVKILHDGLDEDDELRFQQEAAYLSRFSNPHIVAVLGYGRDAWTAPRHVDLSSEPWFASFSQSAPIKTYIALEWIDGDTLEQVYQRGEDGRPPVRTLVSWMHQAARALEAVHAVGLLHRDVKPGNLMVTEDGVVKLMDFGVARTRDETRTLLTSVGGAVGTPAYMPPEQLLARDAAADVGPAADVYGLCATFYELLTSTRLFDHGDLPAATVEREKIGGALPTAPRAHDATLPWEVETVLLGGLQPEVSDRYATAEALAGDLQRVLDDAPIHYRRPSMWRKLQLSYRRNRTSFRLSALFLGLAVAGTATYVLSLRAEQQRTADKEREASTQRDRALAERAASEAARARLLIEQARDEILAQRPARALPALLAARELGVTPETDAPLWAQAAVASPGPLWTVRASKPATALVTLDKAGWVGAGDTMISATDGSVVPVASGVVPLGPERLEDWYSEGAAEPYRDRRGAYEVRVETNSDEVQVVEVWSVPRSRRVSRVRCGDHGEPEILYRFSPALLTERGEIIGLCSRDWMGAANTNSLVLFAPGAERREIALNFEGGDYNQIQLSRDAKRIAVVDQHLKTPVVDGETAAWSAVPFAGATAIALAPDDRHLAVGTSAGRIQIWDLDTGAELAALAASDAEVVSMAFSADGAVLVSADQNNVVRGWSVHELRAADVTPELDGDGKVLSVAATRTGPQWITRSGQTIRLHSPGGPTVSLELEAGWQVGDLARADETILAMSAYRPDDYRSVLQLARPARAALETAGELGALELSPDGALLVSDTRLLDSRTLEPVAKLDTPSVRLAVFAADRIALICNRRPGYLSDEFEYLLVTDHDGKTIATDYLYQESVDDDEEEDDGKRTPMGVHALAANAGLIAYGGCDGSVYGMDPATGKRTAALDLPIGGCAVRLALADRGSSGAVEIRGGTLLGFDLAAKQMSPVLLTRVRAWSLSRSGRYLAAANQDGELTIVDLPSRQPVARRRNLGRIDQLAMDPDDTTIWLIAGGRGHRLLWRPAIAHDAATASPFALDGATVIVRD